MINWLYFCAGISISYNRLLDITRDLANQILHKYERDRVFIPYNLKKNICIIITKENIGHNARLTTSIKNYHGASFSFFQFLSVTFPGDNISYYDELSTTTKPSKSW